MHLVLLGYMGSGKSAVGKELSKVLNAGFYDLDQLVEESQELSIREIFKEKGEIYFRKEEARVLRDFFASHSRTVLALGGGTPCYAGNMEYLIQNEQVKTIYLKTGLDSLCARLWRERDKRPLIAHLSSKDTLEDFVRKHMFERAPYYEQADLIVLTDDLSPTEVSRKIIARLF